MFPNIRHQRIQLTAFAATILTAMLVACSTPPVSIKKTPGTHPTTMQVTLSVQPVNGDVAQPIAGLIHADIYVFDVPIGSISNNPAFWSNVDESRIGDGAATTTLLAHNGLRAGIARKKDWSHFRAFFNRLPDRTKKISITNERVDLMRIDVDKPAPDEDIFVYDSEDHLQGRTFEDAINQMTLSFQPIAASPGVVRFAVCPVVKMSRHRTQFSALNQEYESPFEDLYRYFGMDLIATVEPNEFMIISPGPAAARSTSIGSRFLINAIAPEKLEQVLVIVPTFLRMDGKPFEFLDTSVNHP